MMITDGFTFVVTEQSSEVLHIKVSHGKFSWDGVKSTQECFQLLQMFDANISTETPFSAAQFQVVLEQSVSKSGFFPALFSFLVDANNPTLLMLSYVRSLEYQVENLSSKLLKSDMRLEKLEKSFRASPPSMLTKGSSSESNFSIVPSVTTDIDDLDEAADFSTTQRLGIAEKDSVDEAILEEKKKWEEVGLDTSVEEPIDDSVLDSFFHSDSLLAQSLASEGCSPLDSLTETQLQSVYVEFDELLQLLQPHESQLAYRNLAKSFVGKQIRVSLNTLVFDCGMHALCCSLPTDPLKLSIPLTQQQLTHWHSSLAERLKLVAEGHVQTRAPGQSMDSERDDLTEVFQANMRNLSVQLDGTGLGQIGSASNNGGNKNIGSPIPATNNSSMLVQFQLDSIECIVGSNQRFDLCNVAFLQEVADLVGKDNLFKRSLLLIRCWWEYEASTYAGMVMKGSLSDVAIAFMLVTIFNNFHTAISHPLQALVHFLREFSLYDGVTQAVSLQGIVPFADSMTVGDNVPCVVRVQPHQLVSQELLEKYWQMLFVHDAATVFCSIGPNVGLNTGSVGSGSYSSANSSWPPQNMQSLSPAMQFKVRQTMLQSMQRNLSSFEKTSFFNIVHPFAFCNLVTDKIVAHAAPVNGHSPQQLQARRLTSVSKVLQLSCHSILSLLDGFRQQNTCAADVVGRFLPSVSPRLISPFRPDALGNTILIGNTGKTFLDDASHRNLLNCSIEKLIDAVLYSNFIAENILSESAILTFCADTLLVKGPLPAGELGKLLSEASSIVNLSHKLRERFGGLKKFLERFADKFIFSNDHPFNPHVLLRSAISAENLELIDRGIFPIHLISKSARAAAAAQAAKKTVKSSSTSGSGSVAGSNSPQQSLSPSPVINFNEYPSNTSPGQYFKTPPSLPSPQLSTGNIGGLNGKSPYGSRYFPNPSPTQTQTRGPIALNSGASSDPFGPPAMLFNKPPAQSFGSVSQLPSSAASHSAARLRGEFFHNAPKSVSSSVTSNVPTTMNRYSGNYVNHGYNTNGNSSALGLTNGNLNPLSNGNKASGDDFYFSKFNPMPPKSSSSLNSTNSSTNNSTNNGVTGSNNSLNGSGGEMFGDGQRNSFMISGEDQQIFINEFSNSAPNSGNQSYSSFSFGPY